MSTFDVRRPLTREQLHRALGMGAAVGAAAAFTGFYLAKVLMERERLKRPPGVPIIDARADEARPPRRAERPPVRPLEP